MGLVYNLETGRVVLPLEYDTIETRAFKVNDVYLVEVSKANKVGLVNTAGQVVLPAKYEQYDWIFADKMVVGYNDRQWQAAFDLSGKPHFVHAGLKPSVPASGSPD